MRGKKRGREIRMKAEEGGQRTYSFLGSDDSFRLPRYQDSQPGKFSFEQLQVFLFPTYRSEISRAKKGQEWRGDRWRV
jgi:hypothetical protein